MGAGVTGGAIFAATAWLALIGMWMGAGLVDRWIDPPRKRTAADTALKTA